MTILTPNQIGVLIYQQGSWGPGGSAAAVTSFLDTAIAVCLAESGGNTASANPNSHARGLWQIMTTAHEDKIKGRDILDPAVNTDVAAQVWKASKGWSPWEAYNTGAYKKHAGKGASVYAYLAALTPAELKKAGIDLTGAGATGADFAGVSTDAAAVPDVATGLFGNALTYLRDGMVAIGAFIGGVILFLVGVWFVLSRTGTGQKVKAGAKKAARTGLTVVAPETAIA